MSRFAIHGARGSRPAFGEHYRRYGGNTSCFSMETKTGLLIVDAGTGIASLGDALYQRTTLPPMTVLFTHFHLDHVIGLPTFKPFLREDAQVTLMADASQAKRWRRALKTIMGRPFWPFELLESSANVHFEDLPSRPRASAIGGPLALHGIEVSWCPVWHPEGCVNYRFTLPDGVIVLGTDREHGEERLDAVFQEFCGGTDILVHDAQYTPEEYHTRSGWGHSTWEQAAALAARVGAKQLVLTSHDPGRLDDDIDQLVERARSIFPSTMAATEGTVVGQARAAERRPSITGIHRPQIPSTQAIVQRQEQEDSPLTFRYTFQFDSGAENTITVQLDRKTLQCIQSVRVSYPPWTALPYRKCSNCPLSEEQHPQCPAATGLLDVVEHFGRSMSIEQVQVTIETEARTYVKRTSLAEAVSSLMGIVMVTSGCPVMGRLRPMVRHHLPFATLDETKYRVFSMYLLAQFFAERYGRQPDWDLKGLPNLYEDIRIVNREFFKRLSEMGLEDASLNAIVRLDTFADAITYVLDQRTHEDLGELFQAYLGEEGLGRGGTDQGLQERTGGGMAEQQRDRKPVTFRYTFRFDNGEEQIVRVVLDPKTLDLIEPQRVAPPSSAALGFCQSASCPLKCAERPTCPAARDLEEVVKMFAGHPSMEPVNVSIDTEARTYVKRTSLQQAVTSLVGIYMVTSGCPILGKLKPMVRYHLPFATLEETQYRVISMYLLAQHFAARRGKRPDWKLQDLLQMYKDIQAVNDALVTRLSRQMDARDPSINALVILQAFSYAITFSIDQQMLDDLEVLFKAYFGERP